ncbi:MAG: GntR family transcriptional regulator [Victivallales bacterium]|nr:GntR family transcriptional regulator [Victivallales bacterium]
MNPKYTMVVDDIRNQILRGRWKPRHRLPTRDEMIERYSTSRATIQKAMDELLRSGFIFANGKSGTFVSELPPNLSSIGIIFPSCGSDSPSWDSLWEGLVSQKRIFEERFSRIFVFYYLESDNHSCPELKRLYEDAYGGKLSGVIMPFPPGEGLLSRLKGLSIPLVAITREDEHEGLNTVWVDYESFFIESLRFLKSKGCDSVGLLVNDKLPMDYIDKFQLSAAEVGIAIPLNWIQGCGIDRFAQPWISRQVRLMVCGKTRPDGLVIANENIIDAAIAGLQQESLMPGRDIFVAVHTNFPNRSPKAYDMRRIGFDISSIMETCLNTLSKSSTEKRILNGIMVPVIAEI